MSDCCSKKNGNNKEIDISDLEGFICYCFQKTKKELFEAIKEGKENSFVDDIKSKMKNPGCFCETANPSGNCCLSDVQAFIKSARRKLSADEN